MHIRVMLKKTSVFCREQQQNQQTWLQSRNHNPTLAEAGVSSSSFGYWSAPPSSPLILSRLLTPSSATQGQMLTVAEHLKISLSRLWESHFRKHWKVWKSRKHTEGVGTQTKLNLREKREKACFFTPHAFPQVTSQSYGPPQLSLILRDIGVTQRKLLNLDTRRIQGPSAICLPTAICSFHFLGWLLGVYFFLNTF